MGVSNDAILAYGIDFDEDPIVIEGQEFKWQDDLKYWWFSHHGKTYYELEYEERQEFLKNNPLPVEIVVYCSYAYPMYILAVPGTVTEASRGTPVEIDPESMIGEEETDRTLSFLKFCCEHIEGFKERYDAGKAQLGWFMNTMNG